MPELPEVETVVQALRPCLQGCLLTRVIVHDPRVLEIPPRSFTERLRKRHIQKVWRRGKWILITLDGHETILIQLRMTGQMLLVAPERDQHLRLFFELENGKGCWYYDTRCLGHITLLTAEQLEERVSERYLGPDALDISQSDLFGRLQSTKRNIKSTLLDQRVVSGIGNIYADEILFKMEVHPETPASGLNRNQVSQLRRAIRSVLRKAIKKGGSTLRDGQYQNVNGKPGYFQMEHCAYGREGEPCPRCEGTIARKRIHGLSSRSSYYCPLCQENPIGVSTIPK